jgi:leader peptidase (prepilin peptidase)/N-methyltransferase
VGVIAGAATTLACLRLANPAVAPALVVWGAALTAASCCDAVTQRIPTDLVRQGIVVTLVLLTCGFAVHGDWSALSLSVAAAVSSGLVVLLCWRFAGAGFGDVRLAVLGGLGLGHSTPGGLLIGLAAVALLIGTQAIVTLRRGGGRQTMIPLGPALAVGFLLAATV